MLFLFQRTFADNDVACEFGSEVEIPVPVDPVGGLLDALVGVGLAVVAVEHKVMDVHDDRINLYRDLHRLAEAALLTEANHGHVIAEPFLENRLAVRRDRSAGNAARYCPANALARIIRTGNCHAECVGIALIQGYCGGGDRHGCNGRRWRRRAAHRNGGGAGFVGRRRR